MTDPHELTPETLIERLTLLLSKYVQHPSYCDRNAALPCNCEIGDVLREGRESGLIRRNLCLS